MEGIVEGLLAEIQARKIESLSKDSGYGHKGKGSRFELLRGRTDRPW